MKKLLIIFLLAMLIVLSFSFIAYADNNMPKSIDTVMSDIRKEQGLKSDGTINVNKVSPTMLETLGDAVMEVMIGNTAIHDQMDKNLGGDGSARLTAFHQRLGYNYLSGYPNGMMNLMSGGMMGNIGGGMMGNWNYGYGMMNSFGWGGWIFGILCILIIVIIVFFIVKVVKGNKGTGTISTDDKHLDILKERYAKGEITKDEFDKMKQDMKN